MIFTNIKDKIDTSEKKVYRDGMDPSIDLRSDLWPTMTLSELTKQQDIAITKISTLSRMIGPIAGPSLLQMYNALQVALADLSALIDNHSQRKQGP